MISQIEIINFRSIKEMVITPSNLCALIGPNSTGKTNVLKAIDLVLGESWATKGKVEKELFNDPTKPLSIEVTFRSPISYTYTGKYGVQSKEVNSVRLEMGFEPERFAKTTINNGDDFYYQDAFKKTCHFILIPSERRLDSELRVSQWTMLGKLMQLIHENYTRTKGSETQLKAEFTETIKPAKDFLERDFSETDVTFKKFVDVFKKHCRSNSAGLANEFDPVLDIYNLNWFYKTLQVQVKEKYPDKHFDSEEVGSGMQNLLLLSIFQTYAELMKGKVIFGIEEPEIYLYPQAQRALYKNFIKLTEKTQIFYTTHNPNFVDAERPDDIVLLRKDEEKGTYALDKKPYFTTENAERNKYKIYTQFNPERNEIFFARKVLLVEGDSDKILFTTICEKRWNLNIDELGISIISCGGKGGVNYFVGVCNIIGLEDFFAVWDEDPDDDSYKPEKDHLPDILEAKGLEITGNLEKFLGLQGGKDAKKVQNAHEWALDENKKVPEKFEKIRLFLISSEEQREESETVKKTPKSNFDLDDIPF